MERPYRLRYFFDPGSGICLWGGDDRTRSVFGYPIDPEALPLSGDVVAEARRLTEWFDESLNWVDPGGPSRWGPPQWDRFDAAAHALLTRLRRELGDRFAIQDEFGERRAG